MAAGDATPTPGPAAGTSGSSAKHDAPTLNGPIQVDSVVDTAHSDATVQGPLSGVSKNAAASADDFEPPRTDRYIVGEELGRGGMGVVYQAFDRELKRSVAMKVVGKHVNVDGGAYTRFVEEAQATAQIQHPGVVPVYEIGLDDDQRLFFTMKLVKGRTLAEVIDPGSESPAEGGAEFTLFRLLQVLVEVAQAVGYAHALGAVHRDLKPHNIMVGGHGEVQVMDWGLVKIMARPTEDEAVAANEDAASAAERESQLREHLSAAGAREGTLDGMLLGTPGYMAPEQAEGAHHRVGPWTDLYSLGATLYFVLAKQAPYGKGSSRDLVLAQLAGDPPSPRERDRSVPAALDAICRKAMARDPGDRYSSAKTFARDVQAYLEDRPVSAYPEGLRGRALRWARRHRGITTTAAVAIVLGLVGAVFAVFWIDGARRGEQGAREQADAQRHRAEARERDANNNLEVANKNLARFFLERADRALEANDIRAGELLLAKALSLDDARETRNRLFAARAEAVRLVWTSPANASGQVAWSPDGASFLTVEGAVLRVWDSESGEELRSFRVGDEESAVAASYSPDGSQVAVLDTQSDQVRLLDVATGGEAAMFGNPNENTGGMAWWSPEAPTFSPDGRRLACGNGDLSVRVWEVATGAEILEIPGAEDEVYALFSPGARQLARATAESVSLWDAETGAALHTLGAGEAVAPVAFQPDGKRLAAATESGALVVFNCATGEEAQRLEGAGEGGDIMALAFGSGGHLAFADGGGQVTLARLGSGERVRFSHGAKVTSLAFNSTGDQLLVGGGDVRVWDVDRGEERL
ncbi:MAG: WD40 repeat domain-containing serine/threonine protein kinase, partial [Planctomycetota bacterium]